MLHHFLNSLLARHRILSAHADTTAPVAPASAAQPEVSLAPTQSEAPGIFTVGTTGQVELNLYAPQQAGGQLALIDLAAIGQIAPAPDTWARSGAVQVLDLGDPPSTPQRETQAAAVRSSQTDNLVPLPAADQLAGGYSRYTASFTLPAGTQLTWLWVSEGTVAEALTGRASGLLAARTPDFVGSAGDRDLFAFAPEATPPIVLQVQGATGMAATELRVETGEAIALENSSSSLPPVTQPAASFADSGDSFASELDELDELAGIETPAKSANREPELAAPPPAASEDRPGLVSPPPSAPPELAEAPAPFEASLPSVTEPSEPRAPLPPTLPVVLPVEAAEPANVTDSITPLPSPELPAPPEPPIASEPPMPTPPAENQFAPPPPLPTLPEPPVSVAESAPPEPPVPPLIPPAAKLPEPPVPPLIQPPALEQPGIFTVGETGWVEFDLLFDSGKYKFELGLFSLDGLDSPAWDSPDFIAAAAERAASDSLQGRILFSDREEGARFAGKLGEKQDWNDGEYRAVQSVALQAGDRFGLLFVPHGRIADLAKHPQAKGSGQPFFSFAPNGQFADLTGAGNTFVWEDTRPGHPWFDGDYNDIIFQVRGALGSAPALEASINPDADWRNLELGKALIAYGEAYTGEVTTELPELPDANRPLATQIDLASAGWAAALTKFVADVQAGARPAIAYLSNQILDDAGQPRATLTAEEWAALELAQQAGIVLVVAAGDTGGAIAALGQAGTEFDNIATIGATGPLSGAGRALDLVAAGAGTDAAAAAVFAAAQEVWTANPGLTYTQVINILKLTATDLETPNWDESTGAGLLNRHAAIHLAAATKPGQEFADSAAIEPPQNNDTSYQVDLGLLNLAAEPTQVSEGVWFWGAGIHPDDLSIDVPTNLIAAGITNADQLWQGGGLGLNLDGSGITVGVWEAKEAGENWMVRNTHQELVGRVGFGDPLTGKFSDHATHVAGTIAATGINPNARGMANQVLIKSFDSTSDTSEMKENASFVGLSNHSYGHIAGWTIAGKPDAAIKNAGEIKKIDLWYGDYSATGNGLEPEDNDFGQYGHQAKQLDQTLYENPYLVSVWSAGNDRDSDISRFHNVKGDNTYLTYFSYNPGFVAWNGAGWYQVSSNVLSTPAPDGHGNLGLGYDTLNDDHTAKNTIVVGAIEDSLLMSSFSNWGPTDDGRLKPDVVGNGVGLYSTRAGSDSSYYWSDGTSMAAPNVTGTIALLLQHYKNLWGSDAKPYSSTTKALVIHTAKDIENEGPDYKTGWGVVDGEEAARFLTNAKADNGSVLMQQGEEYAGSEQTYTISADGSGPLKVTIVWTDPAGEAKTGLDNRESVLVNDLDLWVIGPDGTRHHPWTLNPDAPNAQAEQIGRNKLDNVEQVFIKNPTPGTYTIHVGATRGTYSPSNPQRFSLLASGLGEVKPVVSIVATDPNAAEPSDPGTFTLTRSGGDLSASLTVQYAIGSTAQNGGDYSPLSNSVTFAPGQDTVTVSVNPINDALVEGPETVRLTLSAQSDQYQLGSQTTATVTIQDNDILPTVTLAAGDNWLSEPSDSGYVTVQLSNPVERDLSIRYSVGGNATAGQDYQALSGWVTVAQGQTSAQIPVTVLDDALYEPTESLTLTLTAGSGYQLGTANSQTLTITDNDLQPNRPPTLTQIDTFTGAKLNQPYTLTYADLLAASNAADADGDPLQFRIESVGEGTLTLNGQPITVGQTLVQPGDSLQWLPSTTGNAVTGFTVTATDGQAFSSQVTPVKFNVANTDLTPQKLGGEFQVNTYISDDQHQPAITALANGGFVVVWASGYDRDGSDYGVYGQRYNSTGLQVGNEFQINTHTDSAQREASVTALADGSFVVTWQSYSQVSGAGVYGQRYNSDGLRLGSEFQVKTNGKTPSVAALSRGGFVVVWEAHHDVTSYDIYGQHYGSNSLPIGNEFRVNTYTTGHQLDAKVTGLDNGGFVVTWQSYDQDSNQYGVYGQVYNSNGSPVGSEFQVSTYTNGIQQRPTIAALNDGGFIVTWESDSQDGDGFGIYGQRYSNNGSRIGSEFQVNTHTENLQRGSTVAALPDGGFAILWSSFDQDGDSWGVYGQRYAPDSAPIGNEFRVNTYTPNRQSSPTLATLDNGNLVASWISDSQDGDGFGVFAQRFILPEISTTPTSVSTFYHGNTSYAEVSDSPFYDPATTTYLENFEDGLINTPGLSTSSTNILNGGVVSDNLDGSGRALQVNNTRLTLEFEPSQIIPTQVGLAITEGSGMVYLEAFDRYGNSLGASQPYAFGDGMTGSAAGDRFLGVASPNGIASLTLTTNSNSWEVDHIQYG